MMDQQRLPAHKAKSVSRYQEKYCLMEFKSVCSSNLHGVFEFRTLIKSFVGLTNNWIVFMRQMWYHLYMTNIKTTSSCTKEHMTLSNNDWLNNHGKVMFFKTKKTSRWINILSNLDVNDSNAKIPYFKDVLVS